MNDALGMHGNVNPVGRDTEQPGGFDDFESLIHQRGGVNRDLPAHLPGGVIQGLSGSH
jgi:hypothetical protein